MWAQIFIEALSRNYRGIRSFFGTTDLGVFVFILEERGMGHALDVGMGNKGGGNLRGVNWESYMKFGGEGGKLENYRNKKSPNQLYFY